MRRSAGFTLIEMLVAVAILGILTAIAVPSYSKYVERTRRADAQEKLLDLAAQMERTFFVQNQYPADSDAILLQLGGRTSKDGYYTVTITNAAPFNTYTLTATAVAGRSQSGDTECASFSIDNTGNKTSLDKYNNPSTAVCWRS